MQLTMGIAKDPSADDAWARLFEAIKNAAALITPKELCWALNVKPGYLSDAMAGRARKGLQMRWLPTILMMAPEESVDAILAAQASLRGRVVERRRQLTPEEELAALRAFLGKSAPLVLEAADEEIRGCG